MSGMKNGRISWDSSGKLKIENLPNNLIEFDCINNPITKIENLPNSLIEFHCCFNPILKIENLPNSLITFRCCINYITKIENLPSNLKHFECGDNQITKIENLPNLLEIFDCSNNRITKIENLPDNLKRFYCYYNKITKIENLPLSLKIFHYYTPHHSGGYQDNIITHVDNIEITWFKECNILNHYNLIKFMQIRFKLKFRCRQNRAARKIQKACHNWLWSPKCRDKTIGINLLIGWKTIQKIYKENSYEV